MARSNQPAVARVRGNARRNAPETRRARAPMSRVDGPPRARRLARARDSNARDIRRGAGVSFSFETPRRQISQRKRNYSGRTWRLRAALTFLRAAADLETQRGGGWMSARDRRNRRARRVAPGRAVSAAVVSWLIVRFATRAARDVRTGVRVGERARHALELSVNASELVGGERRSHDDRWKVGCVRKWRTEGRPRPEPSPRIPDARKTPIFRWTCRGCVFGACQMAADGRNGRRRNGFAVGVFANWESRHFGFAKFKTESNMWNKTFAKSKTVCHTIRSKCQFLASLGEGVPSA